MGKVEYIGFEDLEINKELEDALNKNDDIYSVNIYNMMITAHEPQAIQIIITLKDGTQFNNHNDNGIIHYYEYLHFIKNNQIDLDEYINSQIEYVRQEQIKEKRERAKERVLERLIDEELARGDL